MRRVLGLVVLLLCGRAEAQNDAIRYYPPAGLTALTSSGTAITSTLPMLFPDGTSAAPGAAFASQPALGMFRGAANQLKFTSTSLVGFTIGGADSIWMESTTFRASTDDAMNLGSSTRRWATLYLSSATQGSKSKALTDNTATAFVRLAVADDDYEHCKVIYTAFAEDTATDARQIRAGTVHAAILNNSGTETVAYSTGDSAVVVTAGTFTCTFDGNSAAADTIDLRATCDTSLAATTTLTFEWRLDCPSTVTVTPQ